MKRQNTAILFYNQNGEVLLQLRDNKPEISWPNHWRCLGGRVEDGESVEVCLKREIQEEIEHDLVEYEYLGVRQSDEECDYHMFIGPLNKGVHDIVLNEGQEIRFFTPNDALELSLTNGARELVQRYIEKMSV